MPQSSRPLVAAAALLLPLAALLAIHPLLVHGNSCGHDMGFHMLSWVDAAHQIGHGTLYPHWITPAAWNAGEPRFLFYPPLSWMLGALLVGAAHVLHLPIAIAPILYIWIALTAASFAMFHLARHFVSPPAALLAAVLYLANPYMLFNAFERSAFAELLAAAWIPLLLLAVLRERPTIRGIALPVALLWLTNAPAAVMGCYLLALLAALRVAHCVWLSDRHSALRLGITSACGTLLGLALPAFYLLPAAYEQRFVQVDLAMIGNMRFQDGFLFDRTADAGHNAVNHTVSVVAIVLLTLAVAVLSALLLSRQRLLISTELTRPHQETQSSEQQFSFLVFALALLTLLIAFLLVPLSTPLWSHVPELAFLQFPWRLLTILSAVLGLSAALLFHRPLGNHAPSRSIVALTIVLPLLLSAIGYRLYAQDCDPPDMPGFIDTIVASHHGVMPTDEYTPLHADNDVLRFSNPGYWLAATPSAPAPGTRPTAAELNPSLMNDDEEPPLNQTVSTPAPRHLDLTLPQPEYLILNLRDYPDWRLTRNGVQGPPHIQRDDGLLAVALPAGLSSIDIRWRKTDDQQFGWALSLCGLLALGLTFRSRRINLNP